jgi:hypothetical protein
MEHIFNVEAHAEHTGWHWCYEVSEIGTFFEKKSVGYQAKKSKVLTRDQLNLLYNLPFFKMSIDDIKDEHSVLIVAVPDTKTGIKRTFTVTNPEFVRFYTANMQQPKQQYKKCYSDFETDVTRRM